MVTPTTATELADAVRSRDRIRIVGLNRHSAWRVDAEEGETISVAGLAGMVSVSPADQVVIVRAGTPISQLQAELAAIGQTLPYAPFELGDDPSVGGAISLALPHRLEGQCGTWREWVLGMTVVRPDGAVAKCGSSAVKNVAGYDVGRLFIGARGALGVIAEVILRTYPLKAIPTPACTAIEPIVGPRWVQRVRLCDLAHLMGGAVDPETATLWTDGEDQPRFPGDWVIQSGSCTNLNPLNENLIRRTKARFDPGYKLNPGALGL